MSHTPTSHRDDKDALDFAPPATEEQGLNLVRDWTDEEEHKAKRK